MKPVVITRGIRLFGAAALVALTAACQTVAPGWSIPPGVSTHVVNRYPMAYVARGTGPTVVLVHGILTDYRVWQRQLDAWSPEFRVVSISLRHFYPEKWDGKGETFSVRQHVRDLAAFIRSQETPVHLVGWSYGAQVAYELARMQPELLCKLVLVEAPMDDLVASGAGSVSAMQSERATRMAGLLDAGDMDGGLAYAIDDINGPGVWQRTPEPFRQTMRENAWTVVGLGRQQPERIQCADLGALRMPVLLVKGELTTPRFQNVVEAQSKCLPQAVVATIPKAGHASPVSNPSAFNEVVAAFLKR